MPLFEVLDNGLLPFRQLRAGADFYESEVEHLVWSDLEAFTGESLFPVARQAVLTGGGRPDIVALDRARCVRAARVSDPARRIKNTVQPYPSE